MKKPNRSSRLDPEKLDQSLGQVRSDSRTAELLRQLQQPARQLMTAILRDRRKRQHEPTQAIIEFDSSLLPLPEGVRPAAVETRRLRFRLDQGQIDLTLYPRSSEGWELIGQVVLDSGSADAIQARVSQGRLKRSVLCNEVGVFRVEQLEAGAVNLVLTLGEQGIGRLDLEI